MSKKEIKVYECKCERCNHEWITRTEEIPIVCPKCKTPYWKTERKNKKKGEKKNGKNYKRWMEKYKQDTNLSN